MELALRVLSAVTLGQHPSPRDVAELRQLAPDAPPNMGADELACEVIQRAIKQHRAAVLTLLDSPEMN